MKRVYRTIPAIWPFCAAFVLSFGCSDNETVVGGDRIEGSGRIVSDVRDVGPFEGVFVNSFARVFVKQDTVASLRIEADDNVIGRVQTAVAGGILLIGMQNGSYEHVTVRVYVSMQRISLLENAGAAEFESVGDLRCGSIVCRITGAGTIRLAGTADEQTAEISGAGTISNLELVSSRCIARISGTGNIEVVATQRLDAWISGVGSVTYGGDPPEVFQWVTGVGVVRATNG